MYQFSIVELPRETAARKKPTFRKAVVTKPYRFILHFADGRDEEVTVHAESYHAAIFGLPRFAEVGRYKYEHKK